MNFSKKIFYLVFVLIFTSFSGILYPQENSNNMETTSYGFQDESGSFFIPRGFVILTEGPNGPITYTQEDYYRMVKYGANYQVIRLALGKLGGWPGYKLLPDYLAHVDSLVQFGKQAGLKTGFKMTIYDIKNFDEKKWTELWKNENGEQELLLNAWETIWNRYKNDPSVFGYDLLNEPQKGEDTDYRDCEKKYLVPLFRKLIDELKAISPSKWALYQPLLKYERDQKPNTSPFIEMKTPIERDHIIFAPHIYDSDTTLIENDFKIYLKEAGLSNARMMIGEWIPPTFEKTDVNWEEQIKFQRFNIKTASEIDKYGLGAIKAWFLGSIKTGTNSSGIYTYAIFRDKIPVGTAERKYITDIIARPAPLLISGNVKSFGFDFATRIFAMKFTPIKNSKTSEIFIPVDRYYPDGFCIVYNDDLILALDYLTPTNLRVVKNSKNVNPTVFHWEQNSQHLIISNWPDYSEDTSLKIIPGTSGL